MAFEINKPARNVRCALLFSSVFIVSMGIFTHAGFALAAETGTGTITLRGKKGDVLDPENDSRSSCQLPIPSAAAGRKIQYQINSPASPCYELRAETIEVANAPSAVSILLTDDYHCETELGTEHYARRDPESNKNFFIELKTTATGSRLASESLSGLMAFKGKFVTNVDNENNRSKGFKVERASATANERITYNLSCVQVTVSAGPSTPETVNVEFTTPTEWTSAGKESESNFTCPENTVIVGRKHDGDEIKKTSYKCATPGNNIVQAKSAWSVKFPECGYRLKDDDDDDFTTCTDAKDYDKKKQEYIYFTCNPDEVMTGRIHKGDENALSQIQCSELYQGSEKPENRLQVIPSKWQGPQEEHESDYTCPVNQVLIGRAHRSDEEGYTKWQCASLKAPKSAN
ncbi:hypothetical protein [Pseudomonas sp. NBRC 111124]|uniref:hypothetical protein n=1 Tax=Pseudomonas sp. NBRC 111124 TaxID=1661039 RepID=UPI0007611445|nr:hypothetical protein [Pseudomonas sp. NBRC 111124]